jgi:hypothetical protein
LTITPRTLSAFDRLGSACGVIACSPIGIGSRTQKGVARWVDEYDMGWRYDALAHGTGHPDAHRVSIKAC